MADCRTFFANSPERDAWLAFWGKVDKDGRLPMAEQLRAEWRSLQAVLKVRRRGSG